MSVIGSNILAGASGQAAGDYTIERSLRFNSADDPSLTQTFSSNGDRQKWTLSFWIKRSKLGTKQQIFGSQGTSDSDYAEMYFDTDDKLFIRFGYTSVVDAKPAAVFRDVSAWYHIVIALDTQNSTANDRLRVYVNGTELDDYSDDSRSSFTGTYGIGRAGAHKISGEPNSSGSEIDAYLAEVHYVNGSQLTASGFGEYDDNNVWQPIRYAGSHGTNGFHLDFADNSSATALGYDAAGSNNWTVNEISIGTSYPFSAEFDGSTSQYIRKAGGGVLPSNNGSFTVECHFLPHTNSVRGLFDGGAGETSIIRNYDANAIGRQQGPTVDISGDYTVNDWNHMAACYNGSTDTLNVFINGTSSGTCSFNSYSGGSNFDIGTINGGGDGKFNGLIRNFRVTNNVVYSSNFTAPSFQNNLTNISGTQLLLFTTDSNGLLTDGSSQGHTLSNNGGVSSYIPGVNNDSLIDTPTNYEADSGNNGGNYATLNLLDSSGSITFTNGCLNETTSASGHHMASSTIAVNSGKWYVEVTISSLGGTYSHVGITPVNTSNATYVGNNGYGYIHSGSKQGLGTSSSYGNSYAAGDCIGIAFDADNGNLYFYKNGVAQNSGTAAFTGIDTSKYWRFSISHFNGGAAVVNFGQRPFAISSVPTGYVSLCTANLSESAYASIPDGSTAMDAITYQGTGSNRSITGMNMSPDFLWIKARTTYQSGNQDHALFDIIRGTGKQLRSNTAGAETSNNYGVTAFNSDGFSLHGSFSGPTNGSHAGVATEYVAWAWDAGSSNTSISAGSLNSSFYDQSQTWSTYGSTSSGGYASGLGIARGFNGDTSNQVEGDTSGAYFSIPFSTTIASGDVGFFTYASGSSGHMKLYNGSTEVDDVTSGSGGLWKYSTYAGAITEIRISRDGRAFEFAAVSVFGKILVDSNQTPPNYPSIPSVCRANQSTGFSIITYTGNGTGGSTVGHGLNAKPDFIIAKSRTTSQNWLVYHSSFGASYHSDLNLTGGFFSGGSKWTSTEPTSSVFSIATDPAINFSGTNYVALAWSAVAGYSAFGSYTGNGSSDGAFVHTGFKVRFLIIKQTDGSNGWFMWDTERDPINPNTALFSANANNAEQSQANHAIDFLSNGFKAKDSNGAFNGSGNNYIYIAFAEHPFKTARAR